MAQNFMTYEQQLNKLKKDKALSIPNPDNAKKILEEISYYSLIAGYKNLFLHSKLSIPQKKNLYIYGKNDLFAVVISLRYLIRDDEFNAFKKSLSLLIRQILANCPHLTETQLLNEMGFPTNWNKIMRYKK